MGGGLVESRTIELLKPIGAPWDPGENETWVLCSGFWMVKGTE